MIVKKIFNKLFDHVFKVFNGVTYSTYMAAKSNRSFDSMSAILLWMIDGLTNKYPQFNLIDAEVLEVGSGQFFSHALGMKILGAREVISIDLHKQFNQKAAFLSFNQQVMAKKFFTKYVTSAEFNFKKNEIYKTGFDIHKLGLIGLNYIAPLDILDYRGGKVDLIISYTVLEHVPPDSLESLLMQSINLLKPGGKLCHYIDLEDHLNSEAEPFEFLTRNEWNNQDCYKRGNRLRLNDWQRFFNKLSNIQYEFVYIIRREASLIPELVRSQPSFDEENISVSGILVVGNKE